MKKKLNPSVFALLFFISISACKKDDPIKSVEFTDFEVSSSVAQIFVKGFMVKGSEEVLKYGVIVSEDINGTPATAIVNRILDNPTGSLETSIFTNVSIELYVKGYAITKSNIYYSEPIGIHDSDYYVIPYQGGKLMITNHKYEEVFKDWGDDNTWMNSKDNFDGRANIDPMSKNKIHPELFEYCNNLVLGGYSDWYVPSIQEIVDLKNYRDHMAFRSNYPYWTSSEKEANRVFVYGFATYTFNDVPKQKFAYCRCVRRED